MGHLGAVRAPAYDGMEDESINRLAGEAAVGVVRRDYDALTAGDGKACAALCRYPLIDVGVDEVGASRTPAR